ncbi:hypothetical protein [Nocardia spumae]|uniref:hypothetical protein n=1 Tax=Nocardia spumae TaxID=2887190 RepID=UPI001D13D46F|nr:hypothetical protein [Nocardia spumae]
MTVVRAVLLLSGLAAAGYGIDLVLTMRPVELLSIAIWFLGVIVLHDAVFAPLSAGVGAIGRRWVPAGVVAPVAIGAVATVTLVVVAVPVVRRGGAVANPTVLDRDYGVGLAIAVALVWAGVGGAVLRRRRREGRRRTPGDA